MRAPGIGAGTRIVLALAGALVLALAAPTAQALPVSAASSVSPSGTATVRGVLLHGDPAAPVGGAKVTLHGVAAGADPLTLSATTDAKGRFVFGGLAGGDSWSYTVTATSSATEWSTDALAVKAGETITTTLQTYDVTTDPAAVSWREWLVWLDVEGSTLAVQQDLSITNTATTAYTGSVPVKDAPDNGKAAVTLPILPGATSLSYLGSFEVCCDAVAGSTWVHTRPVPPGSTTGTLRYEAPLATTLAFPVERPTQTFTLLVPLGTEVGSAQLTASGTQSDRGTTYQVLTGGPFAVGTTITVTLGGATTSSGTSPALVVAVAVVLLAGSLVVGWWLLRRRAAAAAAAKPSGPSKGAASAKQRAPEPATAATRPTRTAPSTTKAAPAKPKAAPAKPKPTPPATAAAARTAPGATAPGTTAVGDDPDVLADELAMLDLAHESGALPDEESYHRVRAALVERLVAAVGDDPEALTR